MLSSGTACTGVRRGRAGVGTACTGDVRVRTIYVIIVIDLVELHPIQWGVAVITPFGRPGYVQVADSRPLRVEG